MLASLGPGLAAAALVAALGLALDAAPGLGLPAAATWWLGVAHFALLVAAPLVLYPVLFFRRARPAVRVAVSLLPALVWWTGEVWMRLETHALAEALWLALSPINLLHFQVLALEMAVAEVGCRAVARARGRALRVFPRRVALAVVATLLVVGNPLWAAASFPAYLEGYRALFQAAEPGPEGLPGPLAAAAVPRASGRRPNIVFVLSDDHRFDAAGFAGHPFVRTPALDRLAAEGVVFTRAFVTSSLCSPSRASFLTGVGPRRHGVVNNFTPWSDDNRTFLETLGRAGYRTAFVGKWHMPGRLPELRGVDHFVTFTTLGGQGVYEDCPLVVDGRQEPSRRRYVAEELTDRALAWLRANADVPFVLVLSHKNVHAPFTPDEPERGLYAGEEVALPPEAHVWSHATHGQYVHLIPWSLPVAVRRTLASVTSLDRQIGRVLEALDELDLARRTLVVYTSDNGYLWGEHGLVDKRWAYEESIRVPLLMRLPGLAEGGRRIDRLAANVDLAPTFLDLAGIAPPDFVEGRSLLPLLRDPRAPWRDALYYSYRFEPPYPVPTIHALRTERYKYIEYDGREPELFDVVRDPRERRNLLRDEAPAVADELRRRLADLRAGREPPR